MVKKIILFSVFLFGLSFFIPVRAQDVCCPCCLCSPELVTGSLTITQEVGLGPIPNTSGLRDKLGSTPLDPWLNDQPDYNGSNYGNKITVSQKIDTFMPGDDSNIALSGMAFGGVGAVPTDLAGLVANVNSAGGLIIIYANEPTNVSGVKDFTDEGYYAYYPSFLPNPWIGHYHSGNKYISNANLQVEFLEDLPLLPKASLWFFKALGNRQWTSYSYVRSIIPVPTDTPKDNIKQIEP